ncbi:MAG: hypothetical protein VX265_02065 [Myxococcota bacterium]|nr:hypothetical protein [Myxococcota bacterium]
MQVTASPLVVAVALGHLGPVALVEDGELDGGVIGTWTRVTDGPSPAASTDLGRTFVLFPVEDRLVLDDGSGAAAPWSRLDDTAAVQEVISEGVQVRRTLTLDGDALAFEAHVTRDGVTDVRRATYRRCA